MACMPPQLLSWNQSTTAKLPSSEKFLLPAEHSSYSENAQAVRTCGRFRTVSCLNQSAALLHDYARVCADPLKRQILFVGETLPISSCDFESKKLRAGQVFLRSYPPRVWFSPGAIT